MRVALIAGTLGQGGAEKQLLELVRLGLQAGISIRVFCLTQGEYFEEALRELGAPPVYAGRRAAPPLRLAELCRLLRVFKPHVIQATHGYVNLYAAAAGRLLGVPSFGALRGSVHACRWSNGFWAGLLLRSTDALLVNSQTALDALLNAGIRSAESAFLLPNSSVLPAPIVRAQRSSNACRVLWAGRLVRSKRLDRFISSFAQARKSHPGLQADVLGDGPELAGAQNLAHSLQVSADSVHFHGAVSNVPAFMQDSDVLAFTSDDDEGLPNVILEAMAHSLPVVSTRAGDSTQLVVDGQTGYLVEAEPSAVASRLVQLAGAPELRMQMGLAGRQHVGERHAPERLIPRLMAIYRAVAEQHRFDYLLPELQAVSLP